jgi:NADH-quinone oxidoreductase subunit J
MIRTLILLGLLSLVAVAGVACGPSDTTFKPCEPQLEAGARAALPPAAEITCRQHKTATTIVNGQAAVGRIDVVKVDVVLPDGRLAQLDMTPDGRVQGMVYVHNDLVGSSGKGMAVMFWVFALAAVAGALFVVSRKNLIAAVMGMVGSFLGIAAIYMMLYAQFLAVVQMLVYAGAIMVLFVFVVMILNRPEDEPVAPAGRAGQAVGGLAILYLVGRLVMMLVQVQVPDPVKALAAPLATAEGHDWGSVKAVGTDLFGPGLFPFEAISILLLVAVVGAIATPRPLHVEDDAPAKARAEGGVA